MYDIKIPRWLGRKRRYLFARSLEESGAVTKIKVKELKCAQI